MALSAMMGINIILANIDRLREIWINKTMHRYSDSKSTVIRNGNKMVIPSAQLVVGDIVVLKKGVVVPADGMLIDGEITVNLIMQVGYDYFVDKYMLRKNSDSRIFSGDYIAEGDGKMLVLVVGALSYAEKQENHLYT